MRRSGEEVTVDVKGRIISVSLPRPLPFRATARWLILGSLEMPFETPFTPVDPVRPVAGYIGGKRALAPRLDTSKNLRFYGRVARR